MSEKADSYESSDSFFVNDGHLTVTEWDGAQNAARGVYAPGEWVKAHVVDAMA
ncbi:hypothetical protein [Nocardioides sp.]|uniref:hypothetical protein n=1 Tax=Nocardioides sp. TaxID=35761 RepID=UPI002C057F11|nr:hypothetical protein [Nocardioides sp.]HSX68768.1 hypothetical protein [Nocardioides sp.]